MPHCLVRAVTLVTIAHVSRHVAGAQFTCPEESGVFADPEQCDKYWVCYGGEKWDIILSIYIITHPQYYFQGKPPRSCVLTVWCIILVKVKVKILVTISTVFLIGARADLTDRGPSQVRNSTSLLILFAVAFELEDA